MKVSLVGVLVSVIVLFTGLLATERLKQRSQETGVDVAIEQLPETLGDWKQVNSHGLDVASRRVLQLDRYVKRVYENSKGESVFLYVGYWRHQTGDHQAAKHSPRLCLPANGWTTSTVWTEKQPRKDGTELSYRAIIGSTRHSTKLFHYWFFSGTTTYHQGWRALLTISLENLLHGRSDGGIVEIAADVNSSLSRKEALAHSKRLLNDFSAELMKELSLLALQAPRGPQKK